MVQQRPSWLLKWLTCCCMHEVWMMCLSLSPPGACTHQIKPGGTHHHLLVVTGAVNVLHRFDDTPQSMSSPCWCTGGTGHHVTVLT